MPLPRMLMLGALLWSMASLVLTIGVSVPIQPTTLSYSPGARALVVMLVVGACAIYPLARISTAHGWWPVSRVLLDTLTQAVLFTLLYWPMQLVTYWPRPVALALWLLVLGWLLVSSGVVALAFTCRSSMARLVLAIALPMLMALGAALDAGGVPWPWASLLGPAVAVLEVAPRAPWVPSHAALPLAALPWCIAAMVWAVGLHRSNRSFAADAAVG